MDGLTAGASDYLVKPFTASELLARVRAQLEMAAVRKEAAASQAKLRAEAEAARDKVVSVLESIKDGFFTLDRDWRFTYVNAVAEESLRGSREQLLGRTSGNCTRERWVRLWSASTGEPSATRCQLNLRFLRAVSAVVRR